MMYYNSNSINFNLKFGGDFKTELLYYLEKGSLKKELKMEDKQSFPNYVFMNIFLGTAYSSVKDYYDNLNTHLNNLGCDLSIEKLESEEKSFRELYLSDGILEVVGDAVAGKKNEKYSFLSEFTKDGTYLENFELTSLGMDYFIGAKKNINLIKKFLVSECESNFSNCELGKIEFRDNKFLLNIKFIDEYSRNKEDSNDYAGIFIRKNILDVLDSKRKNIRCFLKDN